MPFLPIRYSVARSSNEPFKGIITRQRCIIMNKSKIKDFRKFASAFICKALYAIAKTRSVFIYPYLSKSQEEKMSEKFQLKGCISEVNFGYNAKTDVCTNSSLDILR